MKSSEGNGKREEMEVQTGLVAAFCVGALLKRTLSRMVSRGNASSHSIMKRGLSHRFADVGASYLINSSSRLNQENEQHYLVQRPCSLITLVTYTTFSYFASFFSFHSRITSFGVMHSICSPKITKKKKEPFQLH